jgi:hypothetical protein
MRLVTAKKREARPEISILVQYQREDSRFFNW